MQKYIKTVRNRIVILTLTYNRPENLKQLFETLQKQTDKDFVWMIVDDGSPQDLQPIVSEIRGKADFQINYYRKENGGKASATNYGIDRMEENDFFVIIDDDEFLYPDAIAKVHPYAEKYRDSNIGAINFTRDDMNGKPLSHPIIDEDFVMTIQEHRSKRLHSDGYIGYFAKKVGHCRFPVFQGEKYVGPSVLIMLVTENSKLLWTRTSLGYTDYLEGGLTNKGRLLRLKNPQGMAYRCLLLLGHDCSWKDKLVYSVEYYAYLKLAGNSHALKVWEKRDKLVMPLLTKPLGVILCKWWSK